MNWRILPFETYDAYTNMAVDEAVSESVASGESPPTVRLYGWEPSAASVGYFQSLNDEVDTEACKRDGVDCVRRRTGGGAVFHDSEGEVTYSVIAPLDVYPDDLTESYREICGRVVDALASLGVNAEFAPVNDIVVDGRKVSGSAQTRRKGVLLQHGTVLQSVDAEKMFTYLRPDVDKVSDKVVENVHERVTSVERVSGATMQETRDALRDAFTDGRETYEGTVTEGERTRAEELAETRYTYDDWNLKR